MSDYLDQLMMLRAMTARTGAMHEAQILQLKVYPLILGAKKAEAAIDIEKKYIKYSCQGKIKDKDQLQTWVRLLLGDDWDVSVEETAVPRKRKK